MDVKELLLRLRQLRLNRAIPASDENWLEWVQLSKSLCLADELHLFEYQTQEQRFMPVMLPGIEAKTMEDDATFEQWSSLLTRAQSNQFAVHTPSTESQPILLAIKLFDAFERIAVFVLPSEVKPRLSEMLLRAQLVADVLSLKESDSQNDLSSDSVLSLLTLLVDVYEAKRFSTAAYALVNGIVANDETIDQVAFGWREEAYVKVKAFSHMDRIESKTETMKLFEAALEESADQHQSIWIGDKFKAQQAQDLMLITRANTQLQTHLGSEYVFSFCLEDKQGESISALTLASYQKPFKEKNLHAIHLIASLLLPRLQDLYSQQANFLKKTKQYIYDYVSWFVGKEYVWLKLIGVLVSLVFLWSLFGTLSHRIEGSAQLTTDATQLLSAPIDGYLKDVEATSGDTVEKGQLLAQMDMNEILLQLAEAQADLQRFQAEEDKARASFNLVDAEIAKARKAQVEAKLGRLYFYQDQAKLKAPFSGVIVEGEKKDLIGSPMKKGEAIFKVARIEGMYLTIQVPEEDIHFINENDVGEFSFVSQPDQSLPFKIVRIVPVAKVQGQQGAMFEIKAELDLSAEDWWRPGMTGVAKIDKGDKMALWVLMHKTYNKLQLMFWW